MKPKELLAVTFGTFLLIILGDGVVANVVLNRTKGSNAGWIVITTAWAMAVFVGAFSVASVSGAHLNPAVTIGLATAGNWGTTFFRSWADVPLYIIAQFIGAFIGAVLVYLAYFQFWGETPDKGAKLAVFSTGPAIRNPVWNLVTEIIGTFTLLLAGTPQADYYIVSSSDPLLPAANWLPLPGSTNTVTNAGGFWQFTVTNAFTQQFYRSVSVVPCP